MPNIDDEPHYLATLAPPIDGQIPINKRRLFRIFHRFVLHNDQSFSGQDYSNLTESEQRAARNLHQADGHSLNSQQRRRVG